MREETLRFVESVTLTDNGAVLELLKAPFSFVNAELADLYGVSGNFGSDFTRVDFAPDSGRMGLLTQAAFLNGHSSNSTGTSPILRGVFVLKRLACEDIPAPPPGAELLEPDGARPELTTTREFFAWKTSMPTCAACHSLVNPTGFAFEQFDGIGQFRDTENGAPVDSSGVLNIAGETIPFGNAAELISGLAGLGRVRSCYAQNWLTYLYGRPDTTADGRILARITQDMATGTYGVRDLMVSMTQGAAFRYLPPIAE
jgi:hypothetical protein